MRYVPLLKKQLSIEHIIQHSTVDINTWFASKIKASCSSTCIMYDPVTRGSVCIVFLYIYMKFVK